MTLHRTLLISTPTFVFQLGFGCSSPSGRIPVDFHNFERWPNHHIIIQSHFPSLLVLILYHLVSFFSGLVSSCIILYNLVSCCIILYRLVSFCTNIVSFHTNLVSKCIVLYLLVSSCIVLH